MTVTLRHVAEAVGLHPVTVSRMLSGTYAGSAETTARVCQVAKQLGYRPSIFAKALRGRSLPSVLVSGNLDAYTMAYLRTLELTLRQNGLSMQVTVDQQALPLLIDRFSPVATVLLWTELGPHLRQLVSRPDIIAVHAAMPEGVPARCFRLRMDFAGGFAAMANHLLGLGHRRFVFLTSEELDVLPIFRQRRERFTATVRTGCATATVHELRLPAMDHLAEVLRELFARTDKPTALVCVGDLMAWQAIFHLCQMGVRVPHDVSVTGCDGIPLLAACPRLATVLVDHDGAASQIVQWITSVIAPAKAQHRDPLAAEALLPCSVLDDATMAPPPADGSA